MKRQPRRLPPHQYALPLRQPYVVPEPTRNKPHLIYRNGRWRLYRTRWKSQFLDAACISTTSIRDLIGLLRKLPRRETWGYNPFPNT